MSEKRIYYLLDAYTNKSATAEEEQELFRLVTTTDSDAVLKNYIHHLTEKGSNEDFSEVDWENIYRKVIQQAGKRKPRIGIRHIKWYRIAAAVLALLIGGSIYLLYNKKTQQDEYVAATQGQHDKHLIMPGGKKAILQAGNTQVMLNKEDTSFTLAGNTVHINNGDVKIADAKPVQYTLTTPRGGEYRLVLSDGTKVWLNADSKLIYPSVFTANTRKVMLEGEAYFEVKTDATHPFIVKLLSSSEGESRGEVKVLGTQFNVNAYPDDQNIVTTLIKGKVQVKSPDNEMVIQPGEQTLINKAGQISLNETADVEQAIAWKNGYFRFAKADIHTIMKQLARWYDIKVKYENTLPNYRFGAVISRDNNISGILNMLEATGDVHFTINGNEVTVSE